MQDTSVGKYSTNQHLTIQFESNPGSHKYLITQDFQVRRRKSGIELKRSP